MGKDTELPVIEETSDVRLQSEDNVSFDKENRELVPTTLVDIYTNQLNELGEYAAGKLGFANLEARQEKALDFVKVLDNLLKQEYTDVRTCLRHLLSIISENQEAFASGDVFTTFFTIKKIPYGYDVNRFIETMTFFTTLQENIRSAGRFVSGRDLPTIFKDWHRAERDNLIMFANSFAN